VGHKTLIQSVSKSFGVWYQETPCAIVRGRVVCVTVCLAVECGLVA